MNWVYSSPWCTGSPMTPPGPCRTKCSIHAVASHPRLRVRSWCSDSMSWRGIVAPAGSGSLDDVAPPVGERRHTRGQRCVGVRAGVVLVVRDAVSTPAQVDLLLDGLRRHVSDLQQATAGQRRADLVLTPPDLRLVGGLR